MRHGSQVTGYEPTAEFASRIAKSVNYKYWEILQENDSVYAANLRVAEIARDMDIHLLDRRSLICDSFATLCLGVSDTLCKYLYDYGHYTLCGAKAFARRIDSLDWLDKLQEFKTSVVRGTN